MWSPTMSRWWTVRRAWPADAERPPAASRLVVVTEASFLALQGIDELLETHELVRAHYNGELELAGGSSTGSSARSRTARASSRSSVLRRRPCLAAAAAKRTAVQDATRRGVPVGELARRPARELAGRSRLGAAYGGVACRRLSVARRWAQGRSEGRTPPRQRRAPRARAESRRAPMVWGRRLGDEPVCSRPRSAVVAPAGQARRRAERSAGAAARRRGAEAQCQRHGV